MNKLSNEDLAATAELASQSTDDVNINKNNGKSFQLMFVKFCRYLNLSKAQVIMSVVCPNTHTETIIFLRAVRFFFQPL